MTPRWIIKRGLKWALELGMACSGLGYVYRQSSTFQHGHRILTYHKVTERPKDSHSLSAAHFRQHMAFLADHYLVVGLPDLAKRLRGQPDHEKQLVAVTFDDGYLECSTVIREVLEYFHIPATFFVITGILDQDVPVPGGTYMTWQDVKELGSAGFSIGSHSTQHVSLGELDLPTVAQELENSLKRITDELGSPRSGLAYPYGTMRDFSPLVAGLAKKVGYEYAVTAIHGLNQPNCDLFTLKRTSITAGDGLRTFRMIMNGYLDPWAFVDRFGFRLQRTDLGK